MREFLIQGGPVLWAIIGLGLVGFFVFVERGFHLHRARIMSEDFVKGILTILKRDNVAEALTICEETPGPVARIVKAAILHRGSGRGGIEAAINDTGLSEISRLEAKVRILATVAQVSPLFGLLGTVLGLVTILGDMEASYWQAEIVTRGLRMALTTTGAGLTVAILCYVSYNLVAGKIEALVVDMERASYEVVAFLTGSNDT